MTPSSPQQRDRDKVARLLREAQESLAKKNLLPSIPPDLSREKLPEKPVISTPAVSQADFAKSHAEIVKAKREEYHEAERRLREEKNTELKAELNSLERASLNLDWNEAQSKALRLGAEEQKSICLIGQAGTGKTTCARELIRRLSREGKIGPITSGTKYLVPGLPGVAVLSFTNRAVKNIARGMPGDLKAHCLTVHKLLEFKPEKIMVKTAEGELKESMRFLPARNSLNPLPPQLKCIVFEESSMISTELFKQLEDALPHDCQMIFLGDLQQLPPVYGTAILGYKLLELPVVELTEIYRQAEGSPIITVAHRIARGDIIPAKEFEELNKACGGKVTFRPWKKRFDDFGALHIMNLWFRDLIKNNMYDAEKDMIMIPFNKKFGTIEFNKNLAQYLGKTRDATVYEIIAGFNKHYFAVGDKVLCDRQEAIIEAININDMYKGVMPQEPDKRLNRWGMIEVDKNDKGKETHELTEKEIEDIDNFLLSQQSKADDNEEVKQQASHILVCRLIDSDEIVEVRTTGEYSSCLFAYALTVHKCQGSEWRKCFLLLHNSHATMLSRELLYTAVTRAREELYIICEPETFVKGVKTQRIRGNTIAEKAEFFKGKLEKEL